MVSRELSAPGKTFLLGEYLALMGGPAILLCTAPRFRLRIESSPKSELVGIHPDSPAGKFVARHPAYFENLSLHFEDPYRGIGGLGASSAQFALCFAWQQQRSAISDSDIFLALEEYQQVAWDGQGIAPSGADVAVQFKGGICYFHKKTGLLEANTWPFVDSEFCLLHTGKKLATHHHLKELDQLNFSDLEGIVNAGLLSLKNKDSRGLASAINQYADSLLAKKLVAENTQIQLQKIHQQAGVLAAKGCGALGADIIFVLLEKTQGPSFAAWAEQQGLKVIYRGNETSAGVM